MSTNSQLGVSAVLLRNVAVGAMACALATAHAAQGKEAYEKLLAREGAAENARTQFALGLHQLERAKEEKGADLRVSLFQSALQHFTQCQKLAAGERESFARLSLLHQGNCLQALGRYDQALEAYQQFLLVRNQLTDVYAHGALLANLAQCSVLKAQPDPSQACEYLRALVGSKDYYKLQPAAVFDALLEVYRSSADKVLRSAITQELLPQLRAALDLDRAQLAEGLELQGLFDSGCYSQLLERVEKGLQQSEDQTRAAMLRVHQVAALCLSEQYSACAVHAQAYEKDFPESDSLGLVRYYGALASARLGDLEIARNGFELARQDDVAPEIADLCTYELALIDFDREQYPQAKKSLGELLARELSPQLGVQVRMLGAQIDALLGDRANAERVYLDALERVRKLDIDLLEQELLFHLIEFLARPEVAGKVNEDVEKSLPYCEEFFERFPESAYAAQVAVAVQPAFEHRGEHQRAIELLERALRVNCERGVEAGMQEAASALAWAKLNAGVKLKEQRAALQGVSMWQLVQRFAVLEVYRAGWQQAGRSWGGRPYYEAVTRSMFAEFQQLSAEVSLPSYIHLALADYLLESGDFADLAINEYRLAGQSQLHDVQLRSQLGVVRCLRLQGGEKPLQDALALLDVLAGRIGRDVDLQERVHFEQLVVLSEQRSWQAFSLRAKQYLDSYAQSARRSHVWFLLGNAYEQEGNVDEAIAHFTQVFIGYARIMKDSAPAVERLVSLTWQRNLPAREASDGKSDRQIAYELAHRYLTLVADYPEWEKGLPEVQSHLQRIGELVQRWEASGEVVSVQELLNGLREKRNSQ